MFHNYEACVHNTVPAGFENSGAPVPYNGIEPDTTNCAVNSDGSFLQCSVGSVLSDGDIGPTHSVDVSDPDQVHRFFVWHRDNGTVTLQFTTVGGISQFDVSYIDIYTLSVPSARIGSPGTTSFSTLEGTVSSFNTQSCSFSSSASTLSRTTFNVSLINIRELNIIFQFTSQDIDWLFINEIQLCEENVPSSIFCDPPTPTTDPQRQNRAPSGGYEYPSISISTLTPIVIPDLHLPDFVSLTCSVVFEGTAYTFKCRSVQWQWWRRGELLNGARFAIASTTYGSSLHIHGLQYSDAGEYMCEAVCTNQYDAFGNYASSTAAEYLHLYLPGIKQINYIICLKAT